jgi:uncharacterized protein (DUF1330 family)
MAIDPSGHDLQRFLAQPDDGAPVVMLNLLRFGDDGRARYEAYMRATAPHLARVGGSLLYAGVGDAALIAEAGQAWDAVLLVRYPSRAAFLAMVADPAYQAVARLRHDALVEAVLQPTHPWQVSPTP